jgi:hypothetical protein
MATLATSSPRTVFLALMTHSAFPMRCRRATDAILVGYLACVDEVMHIRKTVQPAVSELERRHMQ